MEDHHHGSSLICAKHICILLRNAIKSVLMQSGASIAPRVCRQGILDCNNTCHERSSIRTDDSQCKSHKMSRRHVVLPAEFEDLNGGCPNVTVPTGFASRPSYLLPLNPSKDPFSWYQRTLTFQVTDLSHTSHRAETQS